MNKIYKRVFNQSLGQYVVASENAKGHSRSATTIGSTSQITTAIHKVKKAVSKYAFSLSTIALSISVLTLPMQAQAEQLFKFGPNAIGNSFLEDADYSNIDKYYYNTLSNLTVWEDLEHITPADKVINVSDFTYASSSWYVQLSKLSGDRNVLLGNQNTYTSNTSAVYNHGSNNTALLNGEGSTVIIGNNNTIIGSSVHDYTASTESVKTNALLSKQAKYGDLTDHQHEAEYTQAINDYADKLIASGMTIAELEEIGLYQYTNYETDELVWGTTSSQINDLARSQYSIYSNVGSNNNVYGSHTLFQGNNNTLIGDKQYSGGDNNILTSVGASVLKGDNNVVTGAYTSLNEGSNNILMMSKGVERSKVSNPNQNGYIPQSLSLDSSGGISNSSDQFQESSNYSGNFEVDYQALKDRFINLEYEDENAVFYPSYLSGSDLDYFYQKRAELFSYYGYSSGTSDDSILIGSTGDFNAAQGIALGQNATVIGTNSIALGANTIALEDNIIASGQRKLMYIQDGAADTDLINIRQANAWTNNMIQNMQTHVDFVESLKPDGNLYETIRDITADEVLTTIKPNLDAGTEGVRSNIIDTKLDNEIDRAQAEILNALEVKKNSEVAKAENNIQLDIGNKSSITSDLNEAILGYGTVESEINNIAKDEAKNLVAQGSENLDQLGDSALQSNSNVITDMFDKAESGLNDLALSGLNNQPSKDAADVDDAIHTAEKNELISTTITGQDSDGETVITGSLTKKEQEELAQKVKDNSDAMNSQIIQNFENYQQNAIGQYKTGIQSQLDKSVNDAISNIDNLAKVEDQIMLDEVGKLADEADKAWAQKALENSKNEITNVISGTIDYAAEQDIQLVNDANSHVDSADQAMFDEGISNLSAKDALVKAELEKIIKEADQLIIDTAIDLAKDLDSDLKDSLIAFADETNETVVNNLKEATDKGDQVLFERFDEFLKSAENADVGRIMTEVQEGDELTYRQFVEYADIGDAKTLADAKDYVDQKFGELNDALSKSEKTLNASIASSLATAAVPTSSRAGKALVGFGVGHYGKQSAFALGASTMTNNQKFSFGLTVSMDTQQDNAGSFSVGYYW